MLLANNGDMVPLNTRRETSSNWRKGKLRAKHSKNTWTRCTSIVGWGMFTWRESNSGNTWLTTRSRCALDVSEIA